MAKIKIRSNIEIERNFIEQTLMNLKDFVKDNRKKVLYSISLFFIMTFVALGIFWKVSEDNYGHLVQFENIMDRYDKDKTTDPENNKKTIDRLLKLSESTHSSFIKEMTFYIVGNLSFDEKDYKQAVFYFNKYADESSSPMFSAIALQKAAIASEENKDIAGAIDIYNKLEKNYSDSIITDQVYFNLGRIYYKKKNIENSRKYFNKVISLYPNSSFAEEAKKRLFLIGLDK